MVWFALLFPLITAGYLVSGQNATRNDDQQAELKSHVTQRFDQLTQLLNKLEMKFDQLGQQLQTIQQDFDRLKLIEQAGLCYAIRPTVEHSTHSIQQTTNGTVITFTCHPGYKFISGQTTSSTTCNGFSWTPIDSSCIQILCPRLTIPNAELTAYNTSYQSKVNLTCVPGYEVSHNLSTTVLTCQDNGTWSLPMTTVCKRKVLRLTHSIPGNRPVLALTSFNNQLFVTGAALSQVLVYDTTTFELIRSITVPGASSFQNGLAHCTTDNCIYVSDWYYSKVHKVNLSPSPGSNTTITTTRWSTAAFPLGLSVNRQHNLLVTSQYGKKIEEFTPSGSLVRQISDSNSLCHAVEHNNGTLAVSRTYPVKGVCLMSVDGRVLHSYGNTIRGSGPGMMSYPSSLAVDKEGFILVADRGNNRILVLNPTLSESRPLPLSTRINQPFGMWFDELRGRLYVGEQGSPYRILVFDNVFDFGTFLRP